MRTHDHREAVFVRDMRRNSALVDRAALVISAQRTMLYHAILTCVPVLIVDAYASISAVPFAESLSVMLDVSAVLILAEDRRAVQATGHANAAPCGQVVATLWSGLQVQSRGAGCPNPVETTMMEETASQEPWRPS